MKIRKRLRPDRMYKMFDVKLNGKQYAIAIAGQGTKVYYRTKGSLRKVQDWAEIKAVLAEAERRLG